MPAYEKYHSYAGNTLTYARGRYVRHMLFTFQARWHTLAYVEAENYFNFKQVKNGVRIPTYGLCTKHICTLGRR